MRKKWGKTILFLLIGVVLFAFVQGILVQRNLEWTGRMIDGFEYLDDNSVEVVFLGQSHMQGGVQPMELYKNAGIRSYNLATSGQPIAVSYIMLKKALETQKPLVAVLDAGSLFHVVNAADDSQWWYAFNALEMDGIKQELIRLYEEMPFNDGTLPIVFPIMKYHSRWSELTQKDFSPERYGLYYTGGSYMNTQIRPAVMTVEEANSVIDESAVRDTGSVHYYYGDGTAESESIETPYFDPEISEYNLSCFLKIKELCDENGIQLVLTKIPSLFYPQNYASWTVQKSNITKEFAAEYQVPFYDLMYEYAPDPIDWSTDSGDRGMHINIRGDKKTTDTLLTILPGLAEFDTSPNAKYDEMLTIYEEAEPVVMLETETDFSEYIRRLSEMKDHVSIFIGACGDYTAGMSEEDYALMEECLGLTHAAEGGWADAYAAIIENGKVQVEVTSERKIEYSFKLNGKSAKIMSSGWYDGQASYVSLPGHGRMNQLSRGLNILVYDAENDLIIDHVGFDTLYATKPATRDPTNTDLYLRAYEKTVCY